MDFFDCVMPARNARHGKLFTWKGAINIKNEKYKLDDQPHRPRLHRARPAGTFSRAYLRHLFTAEEMLAMRLAVTPQPVVLQRPDGHASGRSWTRGPLTRSGRNTAKGWMRRL